MSDNCKTIEITIDDLPDNILMFRWVDGGFVLLDFNKQAQKRDSLEWGMIGKKVEDVFQAAINDNFMEKLFKVYTLNKTQKIKIKHSLDDNSSFWRSYTIKKLSNDDLIVLYKDKKKKSANKHFKNALVKLAQIESENLEKTFKKILKIINRSLAVSRSSIWLYSKDKDSLELVGLYAQQHKKFMNKSDISIKIPQSCIRTLRSKTPLLLQANKENILCKVFARYMELSSSSSFLVTPLLINGEVTGVLVNASNEESHKWNKSEIDFSVAVASSISLNIEIQKRKESEAKFNNIAEISQIGFFIYRDGFVYVNRAFEKMTGYTFNELKKIKAWQFFEEHKQEEIKEAIERRLRGESFFKEYSDVKIIKKNAELRLMRVAVDTIVHEGEYAGAGSIVDITEIVHQKEKVALLAKALEYTDKLVFITNLNGDIVYVNDAFVTLSGYTREELMGTQPSILKSKTKDEAFYQKLWNTILSGKMYHDVIVDQSKDGKDFYVEFNIAPIFGKEKRIEHFVFTGSDVSNRVKIENKLKQLATIDSLTKVYNRYKINEIIEHQIARSRRYKELFSVLMIDIDYFKRINDTYGHYVGDVVLKKLSELISANIREVDSFGRWGGEEFMLLLQNTTQSEAIYIAQKLRMLVENFSIENLYKITISVGVATYRENDTKKSLLERADKALYKSKKDGRNRVTFE